MKYRSILNRKIFLCFSIFLTIMIIPDLSADIFVVTNTNDSGVGSLREAIENSNNHSGADTIIFNINISDPGYDAAKGIWLIQPLSSLSPISDDSTIIDGTTQASFIGGDPNPSGPEIVLNGSNVGSATGLMLNSSYNTIMGLTINGFIYSQIEIYSSYNNIKGCFLGPDYKGDSRIAGCGYGIFISLGAMYNIVGGTEEVERNVISGNSDGGIIIRSASCKNTIAGNYIGLTASGTDTLGNKVNGIQILNSSKSNVIGPGNVISGNLGYGIEIFDAGCDSNIVKGNYIGTDAEGVRELGNFFNGVYIHLGARYNIIGGSSDEDRNIISGNFRSGIEIYGEGTDFNVVEGNYVGLSSTGDSLGNGYSGISITFSASNNCIGPGNVISSNHGSGIAITRQSTNDNTIKGNLIGTSPAGNESSGNGQFGIRISSGKFNLVGGELEEDRNIISGNYLDGISINSSDSVVVRGNYIGTDITGTQKIPNKKKGVFLMGPAEHIICRGNVISGNSDVGLILENYISHSLISDNKIGVGSDGTTNLGNGGDGIWIYSNSSDNTVGPGNIIAYNKNDGVNISGSSTLHNRITRNSIYSNGYANINNSNGGNLELEPPEILGFGSVYGTAVPNSIVEIFSGSDKESGVVFEDSVITDAQGNFIWNGTPEGPWVTATARDAQGNTSEFSAGKLYGDIVVTTTADTGEGSLRNAIELANQSIGPDTIIFNIPDTDPGFNGTVWVISPLSSLPSINDSCTVIRGETQTEFLSDTNPDGPEIMLDGRNQASVDGFDLYSSKNTISGLIISGFKGIGIYLYGADCRENRIINNYIGTNAAGNDTLPNSTGIYISDDGGGNIIGEAGAGKGNVISGNKGKGIYIRLSSNNYIVNNIIGLSAGGDKKVPNQLEGIYLYATGKTVIGGCEDNRNIISGNGDYGVRIYGQNSNDNRVAYNYIGTDITGTKSLGNIRTGITVSSNANHNNIGPGNVISGNHTYGISISGAGSDSNYVYGNFIGLNAAGNDTIPNSLSGVIIGYNAKYNFIGGSGEEERNIISGNGSCGIYVYIDSTAYNVFQNNYIGTDVTGTKDLGNGYYGVHCGGLANIFENNIISGNNGGVEIYNSTGGNIIRNNKIGVQADGLSPLPNNEYGVRVSGYASCDTIGPSNVIWYNKLQGIYLSGSDVRKIFITENSISNNGSGGIYLLSGANNNMAAPVITGKDPVTGTAPPNSVIEVFSDSLDQGRIFEGRTTADDLGNWTYSGTVTGPYATAVAIDDSGNTSGFSNYLAVSVKQINSEDVLPKEFFLRQNYPNPFNPETTISFGVREMSRVTLRIYNSLGQQVTTLIDKNYQPGVYRVKLNMSGFASGIYIYKINIKGFSASRKMIIME